MKPLVEPSTHRLSEWLDPIATPEIEFTGVSEDSRQIKAGYIYLLWNHRNTTYIQQAIDQGAVALVCDKSFSAPIPVIEIPNLHQLRLSFYQKLYGTRRLPFPLIGVTGTNGKSSIVHFLSQLLLTHYEKVGLMGTLGNGWVTSSGNDQVVESPLTTQDALSLQQWMGSFKQANVDAAAMEVSSHAIDQQRIEGLEFRVKILSNVTQDHLDYHGSYSTYRAVKMSFFKPDHSCTFIVNEDDPCGQQLIQRYRQSDQPYYSYSIRDPKADFYAKHIHSTESGYAFELHAFKQIHQLTLNLKGLFQLSNLLASLAAVKALTGDCSRVLSKASHLCAAPGRLERMSGGGDITVYVDFAHTPDALQSVLRSLREETQGRLICLFGCGGDRDIGKRAKMGQISQALADVTVITDDNPRTESPAQIRAHIQQGAPNSMVIADRAQAIQKAVDFAQAGDVLLIAGKGHESYQIIGSKRFHFSDQAIAKAALMKRYT